jgi:hypothetical protein
MKFGQFSSDDAGPTKSSEQHAKAFPLCGRYLMTWMNPGILKQKVPKTWNAFVKWCASEDVATEACTWGSGPLVQINSQAVGHANGRFTGGDIVFIHGKVANSYEKGDGWMVWESTVLHEMIHWARRKQKLDNPPGVAEVGKEFEKEAYGGDVSLGMWRPG